MMCKSMMGFDWGLSDSVPPIANWHMPPALPTTVVFNKWSTKQYGHNLATEDCLLK
jgi:hypothetical protein